jgi:hypothetical protein
MMNALPKFMFLVLVPFVLAAVLHVNDTEGWYLAYLDSIYNGLGEKSEAISWVISILMLLLGGALGYRFVLATDAEEQADTFNRILYRIAFAIFAPLFLFSLIYWASFAWHYGASFALSG